MDTIFAVSSGRPPAAIAVLRISGPRAMAAAERLAGRLPEPRRAGLRAVRGAGGALLDRALVLVFPGPATATGEDLVEFHCHGGRAVVDAVERALAGMAELRPAEPGEFTRRALANGRIDLSEAEGLADLLEAETEAQRVAAIAAAEGKVSRSVRGWMDRLAMLSAQVEALLDFADEDDVAADDRLFDAVRAGMTTLSAEIAGAADAPPVDRLRDGLRIVIAGPPNSGKSTLLNCLAERDAAIVSPISGTTRDRIEAHVVRNGIAYVLIDTAGLTESGDPIERIGVELARDAMVRADILLWLADEAPPHPAIWLQARADLAGRETLLPGRDLLVARDDAAMLGTMWGTIEAAAAALLPRLDALPLKRHQISVCRRASERLDTASSDALIVAEHLRLARADLAHILGIDATETMLDALFSRFCIGK